MPRESKKSKRERATEICRRMGELYPGVKSALTFTNPFELVICVLLSAQTTDAGVNRVTPELFSRWPNAEAMAAAAPEEVGRRHCGGHSRVPPGNALWAHPGNNARGGREGPS